MAVATGSMSNLFRCTVTSQRPGCSPGTAMTRCPVATRRWRKPPSSPSWPPLEIWPPCWRCCPTHCHISRARCYCGRCCCCNSNGGLYKTKKKQILIRSNQSRDIFVVVLSGCRTDDNVVRNYWKTDENKRVVGQRSISIRGSTKSLVIIAYNN